MSRLIALPVALLAVLTFCNGCTTPPVIKPVAEKNVLLPTSCPVLSQVAPKDFGQTALMLEETSAQYNICRKAALADQQ